MGTVKTLLIPTDGSPSVMEIDGASLDAFQGVIGGSIEDVPLAANASGFIDEEGKYKSLPANRVATSLCRATEAGLQPGDVIVGPMLVYGTIPDDPDVHDVPTEIVQLVDLIASVT